MIPVNRLWKLLAFAHEEGAISDPGHDAFAKLLPPGGVILSGDEVAQVREALHEASVGCASPLPASVCAALALLDSEGT